MQTCKYLKVDSFETNISKPFFWKFKFWVDWLNYFYYSLFIKGLVFHFKVVMQQNLPYHNLAWSHFNHLSVHTFDWLHETLRLGRGQWNLLFGSIIIHILNFSEHLLKSYNIFVLYNFSNPKLNLHNPIDAKMFVLGSSGQIE